MKRLIQLVILILSANILAQTGINQTNPKATLDIQAKNKDGSTNEGLLIPRLSKSALANMGTDLEESTTVYVNNIDTIPSGTQTATVANVFELGFYHWNGSKWIKNLTGDEGSKWTNNTSNSTVSLKNLSNGSNARTADANLFVKDNGNVGIGIENARKKLDVMGNIRFGVGSDANGVSNDYIIGRAGGVAYRYTYPADTYNAGMSGNYYFANSGPSTTTIANTTYTLGIGSYSLRSLTEGSNNVTLGWGTLSRLINGSKNTVIGSQAANYVNQGNRNVIIGFWAGGTSNLESVYQDNVILGSEAMKFKNGNKNIAIGSQAMIYNTSGNNNVVLGYQTPLPFVQDGDNQLSINNWITGKDGYIGIGPKYVSTYNTTTNPATITTQATITERLEVDGNIKVGGTGASIVDGNPCTNNGTISYGADGNFYGCTGAGVWKRLNN